MLDDIIGHYLTYCQRTTRAVRRKRENRVFVKIICRGQLIFICIKSHF